MSYSSDEENCYAYEELPATYPMRHNGLPSYTDEETEEVFAEFARTRREGAEEAGCRYGDCEDFKNGLVKCKQCMSLAIFDYKGEIERLKKQTVFLTEKLENFDDLHSRDAQDLNNTY